MVAEENGVNAEPLIAALREDGHGFIIDDTYNDERWSAGSENIIRAAVIVPLSGRHGLLGMLMLTHEQDHYFNLDHLLLLQAIASQAAIAIENANLYKEVEKVKDEFIATASHDLKNPITSILGFNQLITQAGPVNEKQLDFIQRIQSAANTMNELVQNMMQLVQIDLHSQQEHEVIELGAVLAELADEFGPQAREKEQTLSFATPAVPVQMHGNPLQLRQLFRNLLVNAIKYTSRKGNIQLRGKLDNNQILIDVQDNGYGIPPSDLPFIFDRFYRAHHGQAEEVEGNGLGLAIVKSIVEKHGGEIKVQSEPDKGTCFSISFPTLLQ
jgi:signal transduction histidine kinase